MELSPKEKAKELVSKFTFYKLPESEAKFYNAIQCALICVDEKIDGQNYIMNVTGVYVQEQVDYWLEVKEEINKL